jgi:hypothetical protein
MKRGRTQPLRAPWSVKAVYGVCKGDFVWHKVRCWALDWCFKNDLMDALAGQGSVRGSLGAGLSICWGRFLGIGT